MLKNPWENSSLSSISYEKLTEELPQNFEKTDGFYQYTGSLYKENDWKLHISVVEDKVPQAFDCIITTLKANFHSFKVISHDYPEYDRHKKGAQITVYLDEIHEQNLDKLDNVRKKLEYILQENKIAPGEIPKSDALLKDSLYVSLRNDCGIFSEKMGVFIDPRYLGRHFNPLLEINPYESLISKPTKFENLIDYFNGFEIDSIHGLAIAIFMSCIMYIKQKSKTNTLDGVIEVCENIDKIIFEPDIMFSYLLMCFTPNPSDSSQIRLYDLINTSLADIYKNPDEFKKFLTKVDSVKSQFTKQDVDNLPIPHTGGIPITSFGRLYTIEDLVNIFNGYAKNFEYSQTFQSSVLLSK